MYKNNWTKICGGGGGKIMSLYREFCKNWEETQ